MKFKIVCMSCNVIHTSFNVFDMHGANCGVLTIRTKDAVIFVQESWRGNIEWQLDRRSNHELGECERERDEASTELEELRREARLERNAHQNWKEEAVRFRGAIELVLNRWHNSSNGFKHPPEGYRTLSMHELRGLMLHLEAALNPMGEPDFSEVSDHD